MSYTDDINRQLKTIGAQLGTPLALDERGSLQLRYGGGRPCTLVVSEAPDEILVSAPVAAVHDASRRPLFETALRLNLARNPALNVLLAYDADNRQLVLAARITRSNPSVDDLSNALSAFFEAALSASEDLDEAVRQHAPAGSIPTEATEDRRQP